jgi:phage shock protein A
MNIIRRISQLFRGNINAALDSMEDPVKTLEVIMSDLKDELAEARKRVTEALAERKYLELQMAEHQKQAETWSARAEKALAADDDELARSALLEKNRAIQKEEAIKPQWESLGKAMETLKIELQDMESRYEEICAKKDSLVAQARVAKARKAAVSAIAGPVSNGDSEVEFAGIEDRIRRMGAKVEAESEMAEQGNDSRARFRRLEGKAMELEAAAELEAMKARRKT